MRNKMHVRKLIEHYKKEYSSNKDRDMLLYIAILKGMYISLGGQKGIPLNSNLDFIVKYSKIVFTYAYKIENSKLVLESELKAHMWLGEELRKNGKYIEHFLSSYEVRPGKLEIATLLADLISSDYTDDLLINHHKIQIITMDILNRTW